MSDRPRTKQELYEQMRQMGTEEFILQEMIRQEFWPGQGELPRDPADEIRQELEELKKQSPQLRKQLLQQHLAGSRRKRQETKERRERERQERAEAWRQIKELEILYLGEEVSGGLHNINGDEQRLRSYGLPACGTPYEIAVAMGISVGQLRFLAFSSQTSKVSHYIRFKIPKKTGGERRISAPMPRLKHAQHWILNNILSKLELHDAAQGFRNRRSIVSNAQPHVGQDVIINFDLKDLFSSISYKRVKGLFQSLGYSETAATIFGLLCTEPEVKEIELDRKIYYLAMTERHLPQGSPASPAITNRLCRRLDKRLAEMATNLGFVYTRYADDLTFSASGDSLRNIGNIIKRTEAIATHEGFTIDRDKTRILRKSRQQEVTEDVVSNKVNLCRKTVKRFRATLFQIGKHGWKNKHWGNSLDVIAAIQSFANFIVMVNREKGAEFQAQIRRIREKYKT